MKRLFLTLSAVAALLSLTACPGGGGGNKGSEFVTSPNSCFNYTYNHTSGGYMDPRTGQPVQCNPYYYGGNNGNFMPYNQFYGGQYVTGCETWSMVYPGSYYVPMNVMGYGMMCVQVNYFNTLPGWNNWYGMYGSYPTSAMNCQVGVNCPSNCFGASGGMNGGTYWLGGTLALCL